MLIVGCWLLSCCGGDNVVTYAVKTVPFSPLCRAMQTGSLSSSSRGLAFAPFTWSTCFLAVNNLLLPQPLLHLKSDCHWLCANLLLRTLRRYHPVQRQSGLTVRTYGDSELPFQPSSCSTAVVVLWGFTGPRREGHNGER